MPIILTDYEKLLECKGNKHNQIFVVEHKITMKKYILKIIDVYHQEIQLREIEVHMKLDHKYVIKLIDYELRDNKILMLIEFAKYGDLYGYLPKIKEMKEAKIIKMFYRILKALEYLHANNFVHRDIKPENILITSKFRPKLADFGTSASKNIIANTFCGTYEYMAPEVYLRCKQSDKVDVWAIGILLYEIIHHKTPFRQDTLQSIKEKLETRSVAFKEDLNRDIIDFIYYALEFNPEERPSTSELLRHRVFDGVKPKDDRKSTAATKNKTFFSSMKDIEGPCDDIDIKFDEYLKSTNKKLPVHTEIFDTEHSSKNVENFTKKVYFCKETKQPKSLKVVQSQKTLIVTISKPKTKPYINMVDCKTQILKKIKTFQDISARPEHKIPKTTKKRANFICSLYDLDFGAKKNLITPTNKFRVPSLEKIPETPKKISSKNFTTKTSTKGLISNLYERKAKVITKIAVPKVK